MAYSLRINLLIYFHSTTREFLLRGFGVFYSLDTPIQIGKPAKPCFYHASIPWTSSSHPPQPSKLYISVTASVLLSSHSPVIICQVQTSIILVPRNRYIHSVSSQHHPLTCSTWLAAPLPAGSPSLPRPHSPASHFGLFFSSPAFSSFGSSQVILLPLVPSA